MKHSDPESFPEKAGDNIMLNEIRYLLHYDPREEQVKTESIDLTKIREQSKSNGTNFIGRLALKMHASYQLTFGKAWGEGARLRENPLETINIVDYLNLSDQERRKYELFYPPNLFKQRLEKEFNPPTGDPKLTIATDSNDRIFGAAWGVRSTISSILERIGEANYSDTSMHSQKWLNVADQLTERVKNIIPQELTNKIFYWDEIYVIPSLYKTGVSMTMMGTLLKNLFDDIPRNSNEGQALFFRTAKDTAMESIANALVKIGIIKQIEVFNDDPNIVYYAGVIHPMLIEAARVVNPEYVFRVALRLSKILPQKS